jgi:hypothetical protein
MIPSKSKSGEFYIRNKKKLTLKLFFYFEFRILDENVHVELFYRLNTDAMTSFFFLNSKMKIIQFIFIFLLFFLDFFFIFISKTNHN